MRAISEAEHTRARRVAVRHNINMARPYICFVLVGLLIAAAVVVLDTNKMRQHDADFTNAPIQYGAATVISKVFIMGKTSSYTTFQFLIQGHHLISTNSGGLRTAFTNVGNTVAVTYHIGKSGSYDLVDWQAPPRKVSLPH